MAEELGAILLKLIVLLASAKLAGELAERLKQPAVLGELLVGILLGPTLLGFIDLSHESPDVQVVWFLAQLGALLLLFEVGLETKFREMTAVGKSASLVALLGIVGSFVAGFGVSYVLGALGFWSDHILFHVFVGATLTATSVGITARVLSDLGRLATPEARIILGAAVLDDVGGLLILAVVSALAAGAVSAGALAVKASLAVGFLVLSLVIGFPLLPRVFALLARARVRGVVLAGGVAFALAMAYLAELAELAGIVGAFTAGLILANTRQQDVLADRVRTIADVFVPFFFVYVGLLLDLRGLGSDVGRLALATGILTIAAIAGKLVSAWGVVEKGLDRLAVGVGMVPRGEVGLIFAVTGLGTVVAGEPLMEQWEYAAVLLVVGISTFITPVWLQAVLRRKRKEAHGDRFAKLGPGG